MKVINIIGYHNNKGLSKDMVILKKTLSQLDVELRAIETNEKIKASYSKKIYDFSQALLTEKIPLGKKDEINIFIEKIIPELLVESRVNLLIPNPEWFNPVWRWLSGSINAVLCKTKNAVNVYSNLGFKTYYIGFTSFDRSVERYSEKEFGVLHVAGGSIFKGTKQLIHLWEKHPEWPQLQVVTHRIMSDYQPKADNISIVSRYINDADLLEMQNKYLFHACPSEAEGFGHYINEGMSCGAIVLTNNAPPMNEIIDADSGFLVNCQVKGKNCLSNLVQFCEDDFEYKMNMGISESSGDRALRSEAARKSYQSRDAFFRESLLRAISTFI